MPSTLVMKSTKKIMESFAYYSHFANLASPILYHGLRGQGALPNQIIESLLSYHSKFSHNRNQIERSLLLQFDLID